MALNKEEMLEAISNMSVLEISELVKAMEEKFGISASAPVAVAAPAAAGGATSEVEEKTSFDVIIKSVQNKIPVIKVVKAITGLGLKEASELVSAGGKAVKEGVPKAEAEELKQKIEEAGAVVEIA